MSIARGKMAFFWLQVVLMERVVVWIVDPRHAFSSTLLSTQVSNLSCAKHNHLLDVEEDELNCHSIIRVLVGVLFDNRNLSYEDITQSAVMMKEATLRHNLGSNITRRHKLPWSSKRGNKAQALLLLRLTDSSGSDLKLQLSHIPSLGWARMLLLLDCMNRDKANHRRGRLRKEGTILKSQTQTKKKRIKQNTVI
nr:PREDICTED: uncharacterized protein LOC108951263 [Musa acuminata subsp. malaccensis]